MRLNKMQEISAKRIAEYIMNDDNEYESFRGCKYEGIDPKDHVYFHAAEVLGCADELMKDMEDETNE